MKHSLMCLSLILTCCGESKSATAPSVPLCADHPFQGHYLDTTVSDDLTLNPDCTGTSTFCSMEFTYGPVNNFGQLPITVTHAFINAGLGCPTVVGSYDCGYNDTIPGKLQLDCGFGHTFLYNEVP